MNLRAATLSIILWAPALLAAPLEAADRALPRGSAASEFMGAAQTLEGLKGRPLALPAFGRIRDRDRARSRNRAAPDFQATEYRTESGGSWLDPILRRFIPEAPPNLKDVQVTALIDRLAKFETAGGGRFTMTRDQVQVLITRLVQIDVNFVDTIDAKAWDGILKGVGDAMEAAYTKGGKKWDAAVEAGVVAAVGALKDPHSVYFNEGQLNAFMESMKGSFVGIGAAISPDPKGLKLDFVYPDSGAEGAGLKAGDVVTAVDGQSTAGQKPEEIAKKLRGDEGTTVSVTVERGGAAQPPMLVTRKKVTMPTAFSKLVGSGIGYVYWNQFGEKSDQVVLEHVRRLKAQGAKAVILDVRGNPGGLVDSVASIASEFLRDKAEIVSFRKQGQLVFKHVAAGDGEFADLPVTVLVDEGSASASEILAAVMQDQRKGYAVIGSRSYGKGTQQSILPGADAGGLKITQSRWHGPAGKNIDAQHDPATGEKLKGTGGVMPDIDIQVSEQQAREIAQQTSYELMGRPVPNRVADPVLDKAIEVLSGAAKAG
ncbi:MAG: PDZ domain-containing protein [Elusimicrobia bacterium]|nr:PDZ domain-containing protein [Elusimicrobiota bacterium]